ncbi:MAG: hypothetical protein ACOY4Q_05355 [Bacillota bacterium]
MLWYVGSVYVIVLLLILIVGLGIVGTRLLSVSAESVQGLFRKKVPAGGDGKSQMPWLNFAAVAFAGIIISYFALGLSAVNNSETAHNHGGGGSRGTVQAVNTPGGWTAGQGNPMNIQIQDLNNQLNYMDYNLEAMESRHYNGF